MSTSPPADPLALQPIPLDADTARLKELETRLAEREVELDTLKIDLQRLQARYLSDLGGLYAELGRIEDAVVDAEIRAGLRPPPADSDEIDDAEGTGESAADEGRSPCGGQPAPSDLLKRVFRDLAKTIHPDLAIDEPARFRRHSLMAEANRAYAERDADRLLLILRRWERSPESVPHDDPDAERLRVLRRMAEAEERLAAIDAEFIELRNSAIFRLRHRIEETRRQGWDLFAEMVMQAKSDIARAKSRLVAAERLNPRVSAPPAP